MDDEYLDYDLGLPEALRTISNQDKRELYEFKQSHSNLEWEEELVRRTDLIAKNIDMERLQRMMSTSGGPSAKVEKGKGRKAKPQSKKRLQDDDEDDEDQMDVDEEDAEVDDEELDASESDEDLFDSDEEEEITSRFKSKSKQKSSTGRRKGKQATRKAADSDDDDYMKKDIDFGSSDDDIEPTADYDYNEVDEEERNRRNKLRAERGEKLKDNSPEGTIGDYYTITLKRHIFEKYVDEPFFEAAVKNMFVRVQVGIHNGVMLYRFCYIVNVHDMSRKYVIDPASKKTTTKRLEVRVSDNHKTIKNIKLCQVSNSKVTESEFRYFKDAVIERGGGLMTQYQIRQRRNQFKKEIRHVYTNDEVNKILQSKTNKVITTDYTETMKKLNAEKKQAEAERNLEKLDAINKEIEYVEKVERDARQLFQPASQLYVNLNNRNQNKNYQKDTALAEKKKQKIMEKTDHVTLDPFSRRDTRPKQVWITGKQFIRENRMEKLRNVISSKKKELERVKETPGSEDAAIALSNEIQQLESKLQAEENIGDDTIQKEKKVAVTPVVVVEEHVIEDAEEIKAKLKLKFGVEIVSMTKEEKFQNHLRNRIAGFPALGSEEREKMREGVNGINVPRYLAIKKAQDEERK